MCFFISHSGYDESGLLLYKAKHAVNLVCSVKHYLVVVINHSNSVTGDKVTCCALITISGTISVHFAPRINYDNFQNTVTCQWHCSGQERGEVTLLSSILLHRTNLNVI